MAWPCFGARPLNHVNPGFFLYPYSNHDYWGNTPRIFINHGWFIRGWHYIIHEREIPNHRPSWTLLLSVWNVGNPKNSHLIFVVSTKSLDRIQRQKPHFCFHLWMFLVSNMWHPWILVDILSLLVDDHVPDINMTSWGFHIPSEFCHTRVGHSCILPFFRISPVIHNWLVVWNMNFMTFHILGISSSQLTNSIIFQRGRYTTNQIAMN